MDASSKASVVTAIAFTFDSRLIRCIALKSALIIGDEGKISIGNNSNLQDGTVVCSATSGINGLSADTIIGNNVTIGHNATLRACSIADASLIGMDATILEGVQVTFSNCCQAYDKFGSCC